MLCIVFGRSKRSGRDKDVSFFRIPKVITNKGKDLEKLSRKRREGFLAAVRRFDLTEKIISNDRICSRHFHSGKPACLIDENSSDWLPTLKLGHSTIDVQLSEEDFGEQYHLASSEPYFDNESYAPIKHKNAIPVNDKGISVLLQRKLAKGSDATSQARKWKCTSECKLPTSEERKRIVALKLQFDESSIPALRRALDDVDTGSPHLHGSTPFTRKHKGKREYNSYQCGELKSHPLPCAQVDSEVVASCCPALQGCAEACVPCVQSH